MKNFPQSKSAITVVVATLIVLVVAALLSCLITFLAVNIVDTRAQDEVLTLEKQHIWVNPHSSIGQQNYTEAAVAVVNTKGRDIIIEKISIWGQNCPWKDVTTINGVTTGQFIAYYVAQTPINADLVFLTNFNAGPSPAPTDNHANIGGQDRTFQIASDAVTLRSGYTMLIYVINPATIDVEDIGLSFGISLYTSQTIYHIGGNIEVYSP